MSDWRADIEEAVAAFLTVAELAGDSLSRDEITTEYLSAPHTPPTRLPEGKMAVYGFWGGGEWLKIGIAGPKSKARYTSQHYNPGSALSTLAASLGRDEQMAGVAGFDPGMPGAWIRTSTHRVNILIPAQRRRGLICLLEAFLHARLRPRYEA